MARPKKNKSLPKVFDLLSSGDSFIAQTQETLMEMRARKKLPTMLMSVKDIRRSFIHIPNFYVQATVNSYGFQPGTILEIIGPEGIGKTTLAMTIGGWAMQSGCPFYYLLTEGKPMDMSRVSRCFSTDRELAAKMLKVSSFDEAFEIRHAVSNLEDWVNAVRYKNELTVPMDVPLVAVIDTWSKLMAPSEALGVYNIYGDDASSSKIKDLGAASNLEHSKLTHYWCRRLPFWLKHNNVLLIIISHQNQKIDMGFGGGSMMSADVAAGFNKTKIGGNALNQNSAIQLILKRRGFAKNGSGEQVGELVQMRVAKNSFGPGHNLCEYEIRTRPTADTETYQEPALIFDDGMANWFSDKKYFKTSVSRKRYTSEEIGVTSVTSTDFCEAFHNNKELVEKLGTQLNLIGYGKSSIQQSVPDPEKIAEKDVTEEEVETETSET